MVFFKWQNFSLDNGPLTMYKTGPGISCPKFLLCYVLPNRLFLLCLKSQRGSRGRGVRPEHGVPTTVHDGTGTSPSVGLSGIRQLVWG